MEICRTLKEGFIEITISLTIDSEKESDVELAKELLEEQYDNDESIEDTKDSQLVITGDKLERHNRRYGVLIADENIFALGEITWNNEKECLSINYENPEIYPNKSSINTLEELKFKKVVK